MGTQVDGVWHAMLCGNDRCHRVVMRFGAGSDFTGALMEFVCKRCGKRSVFGKDYLEPARPQVIVVRSPEESRRYHVKAQTSDIEETVRRRMGE